MVSLVSKVELRHSKVLRGCKPVINIKEVVALFCETALIACRLY